MNRNYRNPVGFLLSSDIAGVIIINLTFSTRKLRIGSDRFPDGAIYGIMEIRSWTFLLRIMYNYWIRRKKYRLGEKLSVRLDPGPRNSAQELFDQLLYALLFCLGSSLSFILSRTRARNTFHLAPSYTATKLLSQFHVFFRPCNGNNCGLSLWKINKSTSRSWENIHGRNNSIAF